MAKKKSSPTPTDAPVLQLSIPQVEYRWLVVEIIGDSPLITNRFGESKIKQIEDKQQGKARQKPPPRDPQSEFLEACYRFGNRYGFRAIGVKKALASAAYRFGGAANKVEMYGAFFVHGQMDGFIPIIGPQPRMVADPVSIGKSGNATTSVAYRPYFADWSMLLPIRYITSFITRDQLVNIVQLAGQSVSIGSWRVERGGDKGVFHIGRIAEGDTLDSVLTHIQGGKHAKRRKTNSRG